MSVQKKYEKMIKNYAPKEDGDNYIIDHKSSGIYTPTLEGIALMNPKNIMGKTYTKEIMRAITEGQKIYEKGDLPLAYRYFIAGMILADRAMSVDLYSRARKTKLVLNKQNINDIMKLYNSELAFYRNQLVVKMIMVRGKMIEKGMGEKIELINKDYKIRTDFDSTPDFKFETKVAKPHAEPKQEKIQELPAPKAKQAKEEKREDFESETFFNDKLNEIDDEITKLENFIKRNSKKAETDRNTKQDVMSAQAIIKALEKDKQFYNNELHKLTFRKGDESSEETRTERLLTA